MDNLKNLFYDYIGSQDYIDFGQQEEVNETGKKFDDYMKKYFSQNVIMELESIVVAHAVAYEMQGFLNGFRYAMQIMGECSVKQKAVEKI